MLKTDIKEIFEGYLDQVSKTVHSDTMNEQMGYKNLNDLKISLIGIEEFLNNNPPSTENKYANADEAVQKFHNLKAAAELMKEELRDILLRIYNLETLIKDYEGLD